MTAHSTDTVTFWLTTGTPTTGTMGAAPQQGNPTSITATTSGGADGDVVVCSNTNWSSVDNVQIVDDWSNSGFKLLGCDSTRESVAAKAGNFAHYKADAMTKLCPSEFTDNSNTPGTTGVPTFCDPTATIASSVVDSGTATLVGYVDTCDEDYIALYQAYQFKDQRYLRIGLGDAGGYLIMPVTALGMSWELPIDGAVQYSIEFVKGSATRHAFGPCT